MKLTERIKSILNEISFSSSSTGISKYDDMLKNPDYYRTSKKKLFKIINISPLLYIRLAAKEFKKENAISYISLIKSRLKNKENLDSLKDIKNSDMLLFDFSDDFMNQEGLHRAIVAHRQKLETVPVMVIYKTQNQLPQELKDLV